MSAAGILSVLILLAAAARGENTTTTTTAVPDGGTTFVNSTGTPTPDVTTVTQLTIPASSVSHPSTDTVKSNVTFSNPTLASGPTNNHTTTATITEPTTNSTATTTPMVPTTNSTGTTTPMVPTTNSTGTTTPMVPTTNSTATTTSMVPTTNNTGTTTPILPTTNSTGTTAAMVPTTNSTGTTTPMVPTTNSTVTNTTEPTINPTSGSTASTPTVTPATTSTVTTLGPDTPTPSTVTTLGPDTPTPTVNTTTPPITVLVCPAVPCPPESVCLNGTCQCLSGTFMQNGRCEPAQVFPGDIHFPHLTFQTEMSNRSSAIFRSTAADISAAIEEVLKDQQGFRRTEVVQLIPGSVQALINNIFEDTTVSQEMVAEIINKAIENTDSNGFLANATFNGTNLCVDGPVRPCDVITTSCTFTNGVALCSCLSGYVSNVYSNTSCRACPSGERAVDNTCEPCRFGYSGFNCNDSALLAVVVISCVVGGVLLIVVLAVLAYICWRVCSKSDPDYDSSPYASDGVNLTFPSITPIPRASTNWDESPPMEMTSRGSAGNLTNNDHQNNGRTGSYELRPEGMKTFTGKTPSRYSYLVQGHENPYFLPEDERRK